MEQESSILRHVKTVWTSNISVVATETLYPAKSKICTMLAFPNPWFKSLVFSVLKQQIQNFSVLLSF